MLEGVKYVLNENIHNVYRIYSIAKYEIVADYKDSKLGAFWTIGSPLIQLATYWFVFSYVFNRSTVDGIDYLSWLLGGMVVWFFISPCITEGCSAVYQKINIITKMKFPVSTLPATVIFKQTYNHLCLMVVMFAILIFKGHYPCLEWLGLIYYLVAGILFAISLSLTTSVLTMLARDTRKFILNMMRFLMYMTPIFWSINNVSEKVQRILKLNPIYYLVLGYRDCFFYHQGILYYKDQMLIFWVWTIVLFFIGSTIMYHFRTKFIDML